MPAAIYCRISQDRTGDLLGVQRQETDCRALAERQGWEVVQVYVDDDRSAYSGKPRPQYNRMLQAIKDGTIDALIAWHPDRLHRSPVELEEFIALVESTGAAVATVQSGSWDLTTPSGRMTARVVGAVARHESEHKSERLKRQREQAALAGEPHGGQRSFGYKKGGWEIEPAEALLVREAVDRFLAGDSLRAIAADWNARGIRSATGRLWKTSSLQAMLPSPTIAGLRIHRGRVVADGKWPAIITLEEREQILRRASPRGRRGRLPTSLLYGVIRCGLCDSLMTHTVGRGQGRYSCNAIPGTGACGGMGILAERIEEEITEAVLQRLDVPLDLPAPSVHDDEAAIHERMKQLAESWAAGEILRDEWLTARKYLEERLARMERDHDRDRDQALLASLSGGNVRKAWPDMDMDRRRAVVGLVIDRIVVKPAERGTYRNPVGRLRTEWSA